MWLTPLPWSEHYHNTSDHWPLLGEDDPGGGGDGLTRPQAAGPVRETIFSSEICSVEYEERPGEADTGGCQGPGTILFDDIGNARRMLPPIRCFFFL